MYILCKIDRIRNKWEICNFPHIGTGCYIGKLRMLKGQGYIYIGNNVSVLEDTILTAFDSYFHQKFSPVLRIDDGVIINPCAHITCINKISIGSGTLLGKYVTITDNSHGVNSHMELNVPPVHRQLFSKGEVCIGKNVWIGDKVTILPNVTIGDGVVIGANSVVTKSFPANCVIAGNPAKVIKQIKCQNQD